MTIKKGDFVAIDFTGRTKDDKLVFDTTVEAVAKENNLQAKSAKFEPLVVIVGEGHVIPGLDAALVGKEVGKEYSFSFTPEEAFGKKNAKLMKLMPLNLFKKEKLNPFPGLQINYDGQVGTVRTVSGGRVIVDFNHGLAGKDVDYTVTVKKVITDATEKVKLFAHMLRLPVKDVKVEADKAIVTLPSSLPAEFTQPLAADFARVTGVKTIEFAAEKKTDDKKSAAKAADASSAKDEVIKN